MHEREEAILAAACRVIAQSGAAGLRMSEVAREAGVSSALLHYYFATRRELLGRAFAFADTRVDAHVLALVGVDGAARERLEALLIAYLSPDAVVIEDWVVWSELWRSARFDDSAARAAARSRPRVGRPGRRAPARGHRRRLGRRVGRHRDSAVRLISLVDGLGTRVLAGVLERDDALRLVEQSLISELAAGRGVAR